MSESIHLESPFERYISHKLTGLTTSDGWRISKDDSGFDPNTALYLPDFIEYVTAIAPEKVDKMKTSYRDNWQHNLELALTKSLENNGTVATLREGFQMAGFQTIVCSGHYPDDPRLPKLKAQYDANILRVMHRFHQWDVVTKVIHDVKTNGVGQRYLIEHSAGSGKTDTISWVAHELIRLMNPDGTRLFSSVIVVTDRIGLDNNIKNTIKQLKKTVGLIEMVGGDGSTKTNKAKSKQLATALK